MADPVIKHDFQSAKADGVDPTKIQPSHWNEPHIIEMETGLLGRIDPGTGGAVSIPIGSSLEIVSGQLEVADTIVNVPALTLQGNATTGAAPIVNLTRPAATGILQAPFANFIGNDPTSLLGAKTVWDAAVPTTTAYAASIALNLNLVLNTAITLTGNLDLANPTNQKPGQGGMVALSQDGTGGRTITFGSNFKFPANANKVLTVTPGALDVLYFKVLSAGVILAALAKGYS